MYLLVLALVSVLILGLEIFFGFRRGLKLSLYRLVMLLLSIVFTVILVPLLVTPLTAPILSLLGYSGLSLQEFFVEIIQNAGFAEGADLLSLPLTGITLSLFGTVLFPLIFWIWKLIGFFLYLVTKSKIDGLGFLKALDGKNKDMKTAGLAVGLVIGLLTGGITMMPFICLQGITENESVQTLAADLLGEETSELINIYEKNPVKYLYRFTAMEALSRELGKASTCITIEKYQYSAYTELPYLAEFTQDLDIITDLVVNPDSISDLKVIRKLISSAKKTVDRVIDLPYYSDSKKASLFQLAFQKLKNLDTSKEGLLKNTLERIPMNTLPEVRTNVGVIFDLVSLLAEENLLNSLMDNASLQDLQLQTSTIDSFVDIVYGFTNSAELIPDVMNLFISTTVQDDTMNLLKKDAFTDDPAQKEELMEVVSVMTEIQTVDPNEVTDMTEEELEDLRDMVVTLNDSPIIDEESLKSLYTPYLGDIDLEKYRDMDGAALKDMLND